MERHPGKKKDRLIISISTPEAINYPSVHANEKSEPFWKTDTLKGIILPEQLISIDL